MITCTAITFLILWLVARSKRNEYAKENEQLKMEVDRLNRVINDLKSQSTQSNQVSENSNNSSNREE